MLIILLKLSFCIKYMLASDLLRYGIRNNEVFSEAANVTYLQQEQRLLFVHCVLLCLRHSECCAASYEKEGGVCQLNSHCCPPTIARHDSKVFIKDQTSIQSTNRIDCSDFMTTTCSGVYPIVLSDKRLTISVGCEMETDGGQWTVIQRRFDGSVLFYRSWKQYKQGFGDIDGEFWLGNENIHGLLSGNGRSYKLRVDLVDFNDDTAYAEYSEFYVDSEATDYTITISNYSGNAGDSFTDIHGNSLSGMKFSTKDKDNDISNDHCADFNKMAGFWFRSCGGGNVNGLYNNKATEKSMHWKTWRNLDCLKETRMMIKPLP